MEYFDSKITAYRARMIKEASYDDGFRDGEAKGKEQGKEQGIAQRNTEIAKAMLAEGLDASVVSKCTGLTHEEIQALGV